MGRERFIRGVCFWLAVGAAFVAARRVVLPCLLPFLWGWLAAALARPWHKEALEGASLGALELELHVTAKLQRSYDAAR